MVHEFDGSLELGHQEYNDFLTRNVTWIGGLLGRVCNLFATGCTRATEEGGGGKAKYASNGNGAIAPDQDSDRRCGPGLFQNKELCRNVCAFDEANLALRIGWRKLCIMAYACITSEVFNDTESKGLP